MDFWTNLFHETDGNSVLELAAGTGRLAQVFLREGAQYTGLEIEPDFVKIAENKLSKYDDFATIVEGDMRAFKLGNNFDFLFIGFNSFLHLLTDNDAMNFLHCVRDHMHENSRFVIDIYIPNPLFLYRPEGVRFPVLEYTDSITDEHVYVEEGNEYDSETEINNLIWYFSTEDQKDFDERRFSMRMYYPSKMNQMLIDSGFKICHQWGDYYRTNLNTGSKLQIYDVQVAF
mgnify:CR=1 FL=1